MTPQFTRRHWGREVTTYLGLPFSMFLSKGSGRTRLSMQRCILAVFVTMFAIRFPVDWNWEAVAAMAVLTFALILDALFAQVPMREALAALLAYFGGKVAKHARVVTIEEETEIPTIEPPTMPPATPPAAPPNAPPDNPTEEP